jgi:hypothetical protein
MLKRFVGTCLVSFGLGLWLFSANAGMTSLQADEPQALAQTDAPPQAAAIEAQPLATEASQKEQGVEPLDKGPVHEAFAQPADKNPQPGPIIHKQPPQAIEEVPPEQKPEGDNVQWIKGYWAWDPERNDFIWVSGFWRVPPPDRHWVAGSWVQVDDGWQWSPGYWAPNQQTDVAYLPQPPESLDHGPSVPAPSDDAFYVPGNWVYTNYNYAWQPGYWSFYRPGFTWVPACYYWTPYGYTYCSGYWDYPWWSRGWLFSSVFFHRPWLFWNSGYFYRPCWGVNTAYLGSFYWGSRYPHHYWYGRHGDPFFARSGFQVASFNRVNNSVAVSSVSSFARTSRASGPVVAPINRIAANTRLGAGVTTSGGVTRLNTAGGRPGVAMNGSVNRGSSFATTGRTSPNAVGHVQTTPRVTSPPLGSAISHGRLHERGPAPLSSSHLSAPAISHGATHAATAVPHVSHYSAPAAPHLSVPSTHMAPQHLAPSHLSAPSVHAAPSHFSAPAAHAPAAHFGGGAHMGGGHFSAPAHSGGGHSSAPVHSSGGHGGGGGGGHGSGGHGHR